MPSRHFTFALSTANLAGLWSVAALQPDWRPIMVAALAGFIAGFVASWIARRFTRLGG